MPLTKHLILLAATATLAMAAGAHAQMSTSSQTAAAYETGYGLSRNEMQNAIDPSMHDANGNVVVTDGIINTGWDSSLFAATSISGASTTYSGAGAVGGATAIGNNLQVVVNGNNNTVVVTSTQINNGNVTATSNGSVQTGTMGTQTTTASSDSSLNGQVNLNGF